jgi:hypothetical protein
VRTLAVPAGLGQQKAWQAGLGPISPVAMGRSAALVNSEIFLFSFELIQTQSNPIQF